MKGIELLKTLGASCKFLSREAPGRTASQSEMRRWFDRKSVIINGSSARWDEEFKEIDSLILFPKSNRKITLW